MTTMSSLPEPAPAASASVISLRPRVAATAPATAAALLQHIEAARTAHPQHAGPFDVISDVLRRDELVTLPDNRIVWERLLRLLAESGTDPRSVRGGAVTSNLVALAIFGDTRDFTALGTLVSELGHSKVAHLQHRYAGAIESPHGGAVTTAAIRTLLTSAVASLVGSDVGTVSAYHLMLEGLDESLRLPTLESVEELADIAAHGTVTEWRHHLSMVAAGPWSPYSYRLVELAKESGNVTATRHLIDLIDLCRERHKARERALIAQEVNRLLALSGLTQREFAQWIGTSPSRMSTYVSGSVTPSAALLLRMRRTVAALQREAGGPAAPTTTRPVLLAVKGGAEGAAHAVG